MIKEALTGDSSHVGDERCKGLGLIERVFVTQCKSVLNEDQFLLGTH